MNTKRKLLLTPVLLCLLSVACAPESSPQKRRDDGSHESDAASADAASADAASEDVAKETVAGGDSESTDGNTETNGDVQLEKADWDRVQEEVAKHSNKVVVLDLWSTSCLPCMQEFPNLVALQKRYPDDVVCLSFNLDYAGIPSKPPEYYRPRVEKFLKSVNSQSMNFLCTTDSFEVYDAIKLSSIPAIFVYGPSGKLAKRFDDSMMKSGQEAAFTYEDDINPFVKQLITKKDGR